MSNALQVLLERKPYNAESTSLSCMHHVSLHHVEFGLHIFRYERSELPIALDQKSRVGSLFACRA